MRRREFIGLLGGAAAAWPFAVAAQQGPARRRVAVFLGSSRAGDSEAVQSEELLRGGLQKLGWTEGRNIRFDFRFSAGDPALMAAHIAELVALPPDVIVVRGNRPAAIAKDATRTVPIVFAQVGEPVGSGLIDNLARPGGNVTGFTHFEASMGGKWLEALVDVAPSVRRATILMHATTPANIAFLRAAEAAAPALRIAIEPAGVRDEADIKRAMAGVTGPDSGLVVMPHDVTVAHRRLILEQAMQNRLPGVYPFRFYVTDGGLMSYSFDTADHWRQVTTYVDRVLRGAKPADLPVQAPTKFETVVNLKTAKLLGLTVSPALLARADEVIE
jgi:putative ABC transport system substrate-binding protein